jgi:hypothetical protein
MVAGEGDNTLAEYAAADSALTQPRPSGALPELTGEWLTGEGAVADTRLDMAGT